jgi:hypothetical protein
MNATKFSMTRDINGYNGFGLPFALQGDCFTLAANVAQSVTVPSDYPYWIAIMKFTPGSSVWAALNTTAVLPTGVVVANASELNAAPKLVKAGETISFITAETTFPAVSVLYYVAPPFGN